MNQNRIITNRWPNDDSEHEDYIRRELQISFDQVDRGDISELDMQAIIAEAHRRHAARCAHDHSSAPCGELRLNRHLGR